MANSSKILEQLQQRLQILEDKDALASLLNRYCNIADAKDWKGYSKTYTEDGMMTFESWGDVVGRAAIEKASSAEHIFDGLQHSMTNMQFEVDGSDTATGTAYLWFSATPDTTKPEINYSFGGPYKFEFKRTPEGWRISRMRLKKIWAQGKDTKGVFDYPSNEKVMFQNPSPTVKLGPQFIRRPAELLEWNLYAPEVEAALLEANLQLVVRSSKGENTPLSRFETEIERGGIGWVRTLGAGTPMGIGRSLVLKIAKAGAKAVYACDLNLSSIASLQEECKQTGSNTLVEGRLLDVSNEQQTISILKEITKKHGRFDFFIANAGFANYRNLNETEMSHYDRQVNVMTRGCFVAIKYGSQAMMITSKEKPGFGGVFVVTGSCAGFLGSYSDLPYAVAKTSLHGLVSGASVHLSPSNIRVNGVAPGFTKTSILTVSKDAEKGGQYKNDLDQNTLKKNHEWFFERAGLLSAPQYYYNRLQDPDEIADIQLFLASDLSSSINGQMILADSGKTAAATGEACTGPIPPIKPLDLS